MASCNIINPDEKAPAYIQVDQFTFDPTPTLSELGPSTSTNIKDVWVYIDNQFLGAYELPARIPVLKTGTQKVDLSPGIFLNGIAATRSPYPFYTTQSYTTELIENGTITLQPATSYFTSVQSSYFENFDGAGIDLIPTPSSDTSVIQLQPGDPNIFEGAGSGAIYLDTANSFFEVTSTDNYFLPGAGSAVYIEFDYKINQNIQVGLFIDLPGTTTDQVPIYTLNPSSEWNKIYLQIGYTVSAYGSAAKFKVYFGGYKSQNIEKAELYLDNIKVLHF